MKNLPQNWVIDTQSEKDSPLMPKFMEWFEKNEPINVGAKKYIGINNWFDDFSQCEPLSLSLTLITLEQWNAFYFPEWEPKQGECILVSNFKESQYQERVFIIKYKGWYICEGGESDKVALIWTYAKPLPKESILQPLVDQLKSEAKKLGIEKVNITFE